MDGGTELEFARGPYCQKVEKRSLKLCGECSHCFKMERSFITESSRFAQFQVSRFRTNAIKNIYIYIYISSLKVGAVIFLEGVKAQWGNEGENCCWAITQAV